MTESTDWGSWSSLICGAWMWRCWRINVSGDILWNILCCISLLQGITVKRTTKFKAGKIHMRWGQKNAVTHHCTLLFQSLSALAPHSSSFVPILSSHSPLLKIVLKILERPTPLKGFCIGTSFASWVSSPAPSCWSAERGRRKSARQTPWGKLRQTCKSKIITWPNKTTVRAQRI